MPLLAAAQTRREALLSATGLALTAPIASSAIANVSCDDLRGPWTGRGDIATVGGKLHYATLGPEGGEPLVLLPKLGGWIADWRFAAADPSSRTDASVRDDGSARDPRTGTQSRQSRTMAAQLRARRRPGRRHRLSPAREGADAPDQRRPRPLREICRGRQAAHSEHAAVVIPKAGSFVHQEKPAEVARAINAFLAA